MRNAAAPQLPVLAHRATDAAERQLRIFALGRLRVETADGPFADDWLDQRPGQLLRYLVCARAASADAIAEAICPNAPITAPGNVRYFVHTLRTRLEPRRPKHGDSSFLVSRSGGYSLDPQRVWIDVDDFERDAAAGLRAFTHGDRRAAAELLERAIALYRDDFLADYPYAVWALTERERLRALACEALRALAGLRTSDPVEASSYLERLAELEPFDSEVQRDLICTWLRLGRKTRALRHYQSFRVRLLREFGEQPDFELVDLVNQGRFVGAAASR
jgi:LuxR family transcriptional regulator, maltose regulon positive regulatory protein